MKLSVISEKMKAYVGWVKRVQSETDPNGFDIRINPIEKVYSYIYLKMYLFNSDHK